MASKRPSLPSFFGISHADTPDGAALAVFGAPHGTPYPSIDNRMHAGAPDAFRNAFAWHAQWRHNYNWDFGGSLFPDPGFAAVDLGNLRTRAKDGSGNRAKIEVITRRIVAARAVPLMFGGDDSTPIPFLAGLANTGPYTILQIDAHIDWRQEREGEALGFSSTMRRASEMPHITRIVQAGARGFGSAGRQEVDDARAWGARFVTSRHLHHHGLDAVTAQIDPGAHVAVCLDLDALDNSVMPAVAAPSPGGLSYTQVTDLLAAVAAKARIAAFCMVEFVPARDRDGNAAFTAAKIASHVMGHVARQS
jgi:agmatinase